MIKDDNNLIWKALISERKNPDADTYDAEGMEPGPIRALEDEEGPTSNLDKLIAASDSDEEDEDTDDNVIAKQGRGETAAQFKAANATEFG
tara:strand:+ start:307 stop:579 length:273 start_codon:yes stop_codon:yes gene_type:complete